jgi:hypothetical protein
VVWLTADNIQICKTILHRLLPSVTDSHTHWSLQLQECSFVTTADMASALAGSVMLRPLPNYRLVPTFSSQFPLRLRTKYSALPRCCNWPPFEFWRCNLRFLSTSCTEFFVLVKIPIAGKFIFSSLLSALREAYYSEYQSMESCWQTCSSSESACHLLRAAQNHTASTIACRRHQNFALVIPYKAALCKMHEFHSTVKGFTLCRHWW